MWMLRETNGIWEYPKYHLKLDNIDVHLIDMHFHVELQFQVNSI